MPRFIRVAWLSWVRQKARILRAFFGLMTRNSDM